MRVKIYDYLPGELIDDDEMPPLHVDYKRATTIRLEPKETRQHGVITQVDYLGLESELVVRESFKYETLPNSNLPAGRVLTIQWFNDDGVPNAAAKRWVKVYGRDEALRALEKQRQNIVLWMRAVMVGSPLETPARQLLEALSNEIQDYLLTGSAGLRGAILMFDFPQDYRAEHPDATHWLDYELFTLPGSGLTYRLYMANEVSYGEAL